MFLNIMFFIAKERLKIINNLYKPNIEKVDMPFLFTIFDSFGS